MKKGQNIILFFVASLMLFACNSEPTGQSAGSDTETVATDTAASGNTMTSDKIGDNAGSSMIAGGADSGKEPSFYICYRNDDNSDMVISISFDEEGKAQAVKYKGQSESIPLVYQRENIEQGGAYPTTETYYIEMANGQKNGVYKLTHAGIWDYVEYTRGKDGKVFKFTIDHEISVDGDSYTKEPCL